MNLLVKINKNQIQNAVLFISVFMVLILFAFLGKYLFFRDYSIIWEGAYRLNHGQLPYRDFGIPMGPAVFILPSIYQFLFGYSFNGILYCGILVQFLSFVALFQILKSFKFNFFETSCFTIIFLISYLLNFKYLWYNSFALMLLLFTVHFCIKSFHHSVYGILSGFFVFLCLITKQDYGFLSAIFLFCFSIYLLFNKKIKSVLFSFFTLLISISTFILWFKPHELLYWFNHGQPYFQSRFHRLKFNLKHFNYFGKNEFEFHQHTIDETIVYSVIITVILSVYLFINKNKTPFKSIFICLFFILSAYVTSRLSGLSYFSTGYYWVFISILGYLYISNINQYIKWINYSALFIMIVFVFNKVPTRYLKITENKALYYDYTPIEKKSIRADQKESSKIFGRTYLLSNVPNDIDTLKKIVQLYHCKSMLNMTELTPLVEILNMPLTTKLPLWFDPSTCLLDREKYKLIEDFKNRKYDLILIQNTHNYIDEYKQHMSEQYRLIYYFKTSSDVNDAFVYIKK